MNKRSTLVHMGLAVLLMLLAVGVTYADDDTFYFDAALGRAEVDNQIAGVFLEDDSFAARFGVGYDLGNNIALEAAYVNLGEVTSDLFGGLNDARTDGLTLAARFTLPLGNSLRASARLGGFFWDAELDTPGGQFINEGEDLFYGVGLTFDASRRVSVTAHWDRFEFGDSDADALWAGLRFRF